MLCMWSCRKGLIIRSLLHYLYTGLSRHSIIQLFLCFQRSQRSFNLIIQHALYLQLHIFQLHQACWKSVWVAFSSDYVRHYSLARRYNMRQRHISVYQWMLLLNRIRLQAFSSKGTLVATTYSTYCISLLHLQSANSHDFATHWICSLAVCFLSPDIARCPSIFAPLPYHTLPILWPVEHQNSPAGDTLLSRPHTSTHRHTRCPTRRCGKSLLDLHEMQSHRQAGSDQML